LIWRSAIFLDSQSELEADLNQRGVLFWVAMLLDHVQEVGELFGREFAEYGPKTSF